MNDISLPREEMGLPDPAARLDTLSPPVDARSRERWMQAFSAASSFMSAGDACEAQSATGTAQPLRMLRAWHEDRQPAPALPKADELPGPEQPAHGNTHAGFEGAHRQRPDAAPAPDRPADASPMAALMDACCSRLWIDDRGLRAQAVMLDLGRALPGCTAEVARHGGTLQIRLRGVDEARRTEFEDGLAVLAAELSAKLGCRVVAAVQNQDAAT
jgi:hypothetical protein